MAQGASDLIEALRSSHRDHFPRKLVHLCFWSSATVSSAVPRQTFVGSAEGGIRHASEGGLLTLHRRGCGCRRWI